MTVLVSGFGAFGPVRTNPSKRLVQDLASRSSSPIDCSTVVLDVSYARCFPQLERACEAVRPDAVLLIGVARSSKGLRVEMCARNLATASLEDVDGIVGGGGALSSRRPRGHSLYSTVDTLSLAAHLCQQGYDTRISTNAGGYVCNALYYFVLERLDIPAVFLHIPPPESGWSRERLVAATQCLLSHWQVV